MHPELLRTGILAALQSGLRFAGAYLLDGDEVLSAESWHPDEISVDERDRLLQLLTSGAEFTDAELNRHLGSPPIPADRRTHLVLVDALQTHFPHAYVVGEEASDREWDIAEGAPEDSLIFQVDAIDGSLPYDTLTFGFSVNLLAYRRGPKTDELLFAALVNCNWSASGGHPGVAFGECGEGAEEADVVFGGGGEVAADGAELFGAGDGS